MTAEPTDAEIQEQMRENVRQTARDLGCNCEPEESERETEQGWFFYQEHQHNCKLTRIKHARSN